MKDTAAARTFTTSRGHVVTTALTDAEAATILRNAGLRAGDFARDLAIAERKGRLSAAQRPWLHKLALEVQNPTPKPARPAAAADAGAAAIVALLGTATENGAKRPAITCPLESGTYRFKLAPANGRNAGAVYVTCSDAYLGKITPAGAFEPVRDAAAHAVEVVRGVFDTVRAMGAAEAFGRLGTATGTCCFCARELTDERSTTVGYGPVCADKYGLPWGEADAAPAPDAGLAAFERAHGPRPSDAHVPFYGSEAADGEDAGWVLHPDLAMKNEFSRREAAQEAAAFLSDPF